MKVITYSTYGPPEVLHLQHMAKPVPKDKEVLIRIHATTATAADCELRSSKTPRAFRFFGLMPYGTMILGQELAGEIEAVGQKVTRFRKGDQIFGWSGLRLGTYAQYTCLPERGVLFVKPGNMTYEEATTLPVGGLDAAYLLRKADIRPGEKVLINGAGGSIGTYAVQIARHFGAEVTGIDSTIKLDMLRSIGAEHVIDYTEEDFTQSDEVFDVVFDVIGKSSFPSCERLLSLHGRYLTVASQPSQIIRWQRMARRTGKKVVFWTPRTVGRYTEDFAFLKDLIEAGRLRAIIDKRFPMGLAAEAHRYIESGHKLGHVVISMV